MKSSWQKKRNNRIIKICLSVVTVVALIVGTVVGVNLYNKSKDNPTPGPEVTVTPTPASSQGQTDNSNNYTVTFANTSDTTEAMAKVTKLPATASVAPGTLISSLEEPERYGCMFLGWYYDADKLLLAGDLDQVNNNMTLYPRFATKEGFADEFSPNFVSSRNMSGDFNLEIAAFGLEEDQIRELIRGWNMSRGKEPVAIKLVPVTSKVTYDENSAYLVDEDGNLIDASETVDYEGINFEDPMDELDDATKQELSSVGIDLDTATEKELKAFYGLSEDESLIRYLRETMELDIESALLLQAVLDKNAELKNGKHYYVVAEGGEWTAGELFQIAISDTARLRFVYDEEITGSKVTLYNFSIERKEINTLVIRDGVTYIPVAQTEGVEVGGGLFNVIADSDQNTIDKNVSAGTMTFAGNLTKGTVVAVYDGTLKEDGTVDGKVSYLEITNVLGNNRYDYTGAEFEKVVFIPDVLPIKDDGSYSDGKITVAKSAVSFGSSEYQKFGLDKNTTVDKGDFITFYTGNLNNEKSITLVGYAKVTGITESGSSYEITYNTVDVDEVLGSFQMYSSVDDVEIPVSEEVAQNLKNEMLTNIAESNLAEESAQYITALFTGDLSDLSEYEHAEDLKNMTFKTNDGKELTLEEVRLLADGGAKRVKVSKPTLTLSLDHKLSHFTGEGIRGEVSVNFTVEIELNSVGAITNKIEISVTVALQQEIVLGLDVSVDSEWKWYACVPVLDEVNINGAVRAGTYTGFGVVATIQTKSDNAAEDSEWEDLIKATGEGQLKEVVGLEKMGTKLEQLSKTLDKVQKGGGYSTSDDGTKTGTGITGSGVAIGGDLPTKYSGMLSNDAEYINLVKQELFRLPISPDPLHLIEFSLEADLVVSFKLNCMIGAGISYGNAKQYSFNAKVFAKESSTSEADLETPNFRADFYVFGMVGARIGVMLDLRVGIISTKMDSIGITAEAGFYAELYGFLYIFYAWESGEGSTSGAMGSLLFEIGIYVDVNFVAQLGEGKLSTGKEIYSNTWPLLQAGAVDVPMEYEIKQSDEKLSVEIPEHKNTVKVPDELFKMKMMGLKDGKLTSVSKDSDETGDAAYTFTVNGRSFTQYNEKYFEILCYDTDKNGNKIAGNSFQYLPATNEIYVKPASTETDELWGVVEFTYKNETFGFNTVKLTRKVKVHWKGVAGSARVEYYMKQADGSYQFVEEGQFDGFDGVEYDLFVDEDLIYKYDGCRLRKAYFTDEDRMGAKLEVMRESLEVLRRDYEKNGGKSRREAYEKASKQYWAAYNNYTEYWHHINDVIKARKGVMYFLMVSNETVVKLYYDPVDYEVRYYVEPEWYYVKADETNPNSKTYRGLIYRTKDQAKNMVYTSLPVNSSLMDGMPSDIKNYIALDEKYNYSYYLYSYAMYTFDGVNTYVSNQNQKADEMMDNRDKWVKIEADAKVPDESNHSYMVIALRDTPKATTVSFLVDGKEYATVETTYDAKVEFPTNPEKEGYRFNGWKNSKTLQPADENTIVSEDTKSFYADWVAEKYEIHCTVEDKSWTILASYDDNLLNAINRDAQTIKNASYRKDYGVEWYIQGDEKEVLVESIYKVPNQAISVQGKYVLNPLHEHVWGMYEVVREASCKEAGEWSVTCSVCGLKSSEEIPKSTSHGKTVFVNGKGADCIHDGKNSDLVCEICGTVIKEGEVIPATGEHTYPSFVRTLADCVTPGTVTWTCSVCGYKDVQEDPMDSSRHHGPVNEYVNRVSPGCVTDGYSGDTVCTACGEVIYKGVVEPAVGSHSYHNPTYQWSADYSTVTATATCWYDTAKLVETVKTTQQITDEATCERAGLVLCTATFTNDIFETQSEYNEIKPLGHKYGTVTYTWSEDNGLCSADMVCEHDASHVVHELVATERQYEKYADGSTKTVYTAKFDNTAFATQTKQVTTDACQHTTYGTPRYDWSSDHNTVTAKAECTGCSKVVSETVNATKEVKKAVTCEADGETLYHATFTNSLFTKQTYTETVAKLGHSYGAVTYTWAEDRSSCKAEMVCANDATHKVTETVTVTVNETSATCDTDGVREYTAAFSNTAFTTQTKRETLTRTGHSYGTVTYTWSADNKQCTAERVCTTNTAHKQTETVNTTTSSTVVSGKLNVTYTAQFSNSAFGTKQKEVTGLDPSSNTPSIDYVWSADHTSVKATATYPISGDPVTQTVTAVVTTTAATCEADGEKTYTATFTNAVFATQTYRETLTKIGHSYGDVVYTWSADHSSCVAEKTCANDAAHKISETSTATTNGAVADCLNSVTRVYTATFTNVMFATQTYNEVLTPAGHDYTITYTWADDYLSCTAEAVCNNNAAHKVTETVGASELPSMEGAAQITYRTEAFANALFTVQDKAVAACSHVFGEPSSERVTVTSSASGAYASADGSEHYSLVHGFRSVSECSKCGKKSYVNHPYGEYGLIVDTSELSKNGIKTVGDLKNASLDTLSSIACVMGDVDLESAGGTTEVRVRIPGTLKITGVGIDESYADSDLLSEVYISYNWEFTPSDTATWFSWPVAMEPGGME